MTPKRILHVVSAMKRGGTETLLMNVYRQIDRSKVQFDFVSHNKEKCDYDDEIESLGGKVYKISSLGQQGPIAYVQSVKRILSQHPYIAVHSHTDFQSGFAALAAKQFGIKKIVCHAHTNRWGKEGILANKFILPSLRALIKYSSTDLCACSIEAAHFLFGKKSMNNVTVLNNGIDVDQFTHIEDEDSFNLRQELKLSRDVKILGHVGNLSEVKNHRFILKLLKILRDNGINIVAIFAGDGPLRKQLEEQARFLGVYSFVHFLGVRGDIAKLMKAFDCFVFPSLYEGFGIAALEAQCAGTPCVVSNRVSKTTDMGLGLIKYMSLDDPESWVREIKEALVTERPNPQDIENHFINSGFHIRESITKWMALYGITG